MEIRKFKRYISRFHSVILTNGSKYAGFIENVSEEGLAYKMPTFEQALKELLPEKIVKVIILISSGETLNLNCEIRWNSVPCDEENFCMGMKILDPPTKYKELLKTLK